MQVVAERAAGAGSREEAAAPPGEPLGRRAQRAARPALIDSQSGGVKAENKSGGSAVLVTC